MTTDYVQALAKPYPEIKVIWLIGSRADGSNLPMSDWDYIAIAGELTLSALSEDISFNNPAIDLFIVYDGDQFQKRWANGNRVKKGSLSNWKWQQRWPGEFGQVAKWIFCLSAARMPRIRSNNDEASTPEPQPGF